MVATFPPMRIRITFIKQGALRYTGHLDLHRLWERAMRRAAQNVRAQNRAFKLPVIVWQDGKVVEKPA